MKTLVWTNPETMVTKDQAIPEIDQQSVRIHVKAVGICGSEIEGFLGHNSLRVPPLVMGHEFCGIVDEIGTGVVNVRPGEKVVVNPLIHCGSCDRCIKGKENLCDHRKIVGIHRSGAFAEYVVVPASSVIVVPHDLNQYRASLAEPLACSLRATQRAMAEHPFSHVVVIGAGTIGLLCSFVAKILGAASVIILDTNSQRLQTANQVGITYTINPKDEDIKQRLHESIGSSKVDVVIDAAGFQSTREVSLDLLNAGGTFMNIGLGIDDTSLKINHVIRSEINILASFCYSRQDFKDALQLLIEGKVTEQGWIEIRGLSTGETAFKDLIANKVANGKIFLDPAR